MKTLVTALRDSKRAPGWIFRDRNTSAFGRTFAVHYHMDVAKSAGVPYMYYLGTQRQERLIKHMTNWMGDEGWLKKRYDEYRRFVYLSDVIWLKGKVTSKYVDANGGSCVDIETCAENQRGEDVMPGHSTVILPSKERSMWPVEKTLQR